MLPLLQVVANVILNIRPTRRSVNQPARARDEIRTRTAFRPERWQRSVSTNSTTLARVCAGEIGMAPQTTNNLAFWLTSHDTDRAILGE